MKKLVLSILVLSSCSVLKFDGAASPTSDTFMLTPDQVRMASALDCDQEWYTGDAEQDVITAMEILESRGIKVVMRNPFSGGTALARRLYLTHDFEERSPEGQASLLRHELTHYCDRDRLGDIGFEDEYASAGGRWVLETRAYVQSVRALSALGMSDEELQSWVQERVTSMRDMYWLWNIDPEQYEELTMRILVDSINP